MRKHLWVSILCCAGSVHAQFVVNTGMPLVNSATAVVNGDWDNQNSSFVNHGIITLSGNWNSTGGYSPAGTGGFTLNNIVTQQFSHSHQSVGVLNKNGAGDTQVDNALTVNTGLDLQVGLLVMTGVNSDTLIIKPNATVNANPSSYVVGKVTHLGTGDLFFPVSRASNYLPITFHNVTGPNPKVTVTLEDTPGGYSIVGIGDSLIGFPYWWRSNVTGADTASFVEVQYPSTMPASVSPVITKVISSNQFQSMERQYLSTAGGVVRIKSYMSGLHGKFSVAQGSSLIQDSLALVTLYKLTDGADWTNKTNWLAGPLSNWFGVVITNNRVSGLILPNNNLAGTVPAVFIDLQKLTTADLSFNKITSLPDLSTLPNLVTLNVSFNQLDFASLIANVAITGINYPNQADLGVPIDTLVTYGTNYNLDVSTKGAGNVYQWTRNGGPVTGASDSTFVITAIGRGNMGTYVCEITNPLVPALTLKTNSKRVRAVAKLAGKFVLPDSTAINQANIILLKINPIGAYDTLAIKPVAADGTFLLDKVVLDDYELQGKPDTIAFPTALPSYYKNTIFWESADTLSVFGNRSGLTIVDVTKPSPPKGSGLISGTFEDAGTSISGGRVKAGRRVTGAGVAASRSLATGRPTGAGYVLVAYTLTDDNGNFSIGNLPTGNYRLNIQDPGYPMDTTSFINFSIGNTPSTKQVAVEATIDKNKIVVRKLTITGLEDADHRFSIYPNPARIAFTINLNEPLDDVEYSISSLQGQKIKTGALSSLEPNPVDASLLTPGIYFIELRQHGQAIKNFKIVIE